MRSNIAVSLIDTNKLTPEQMVDVAKEVDQPKVWKKVIEKINFYVLTNGEMLSLGYRAKNNLFWKKVKENLKSNVIILLK